MTTREFVDVLDADGNPTGIAKDKRDVHRDGDWHRCAHVWVATSDGRLLLQRRALVKESWPGLWDISVAGHVSAGESAIDAAIREAREELDLHIDPAELTHLGTLRYSVLLRENYVENEFHEVYLLRRDVDLAALTLDPLEVAEVALVAPDDLERYERVPHEEEYALLLTSLR
ncbi:MAG TPA: NUDIX domain-containing protein [Thermoanaerobaculia bacterium]